VLAAAGSPSGCDVHGSSIRRVRPHFRCCKLSSGFN